MRSEREQDLAPERHELDEGIPYRFELDRREFVAAAGLIIGASGGLSIGSAADGVPGKARVHISTSGEITLFTSKVEVGQGSRTQLAQALAEEIRVAVEEVQVVLGDTDLCPDDGITAGSRTTPRTVPVVRQAGARARRLLASAAANSLARRVTVVESPVRRARLTSRR